MSDLPYHQTYRRMNFQPIPSNFVRRQSEPSHYYNSPAELDMRSSSYHSHQPQLQQKKIFGFQLFINNEILKELQPVHLWFDALTLQHQVESIKFNLDLGIPDLDGRNIQIFDQQMEKKYNCSKSLLHDVYQVFKRTKKQLFSIIIFVPEGMVSLLIGTKGHQINKIMRESYTKIVVNQPINKMTYRTAKIQGQYGDIAKACKMIYDILQEKSAIAYAIEKQPSQFDYTKSKIKTKFLFSYQIMKYLTKKKKFLLEKIEDETKCTINIETDRRNHLIKDDEEILVIHGRLEDVQAYIVMLINIVHPLLCEDRKNIDYTLKLLIPANYVTKLIGQKGYMIKDIIQRSGGAQIKILSDRQAERDTRQCIISINGTIENKIDASCFILQQIECFKNGGPILQSGKSINQNLVQQFKNSVPIHNESQKLTTQMDIENTHQNTQKIAPITVNTVMPTISGSPPAKILSSVPLKKFQPQKDQASEQQGLIDCQFQEDKQKAQLEIQSKIKSKRSNHSQSQRRSNKSSSGSQRSRSRDNKHSKRQQRKKKSKSSSVQFKHDREYLQVKLIVPRKLAQDYRQLSYIQGISKSKISVVEQVTSGLLNESILTIRGCVKDNSKTIKLLQKRITRYRNV